MGQVLCLVSARRRLLRPEGQSHGYCWRRRHLHRRHAIQSRILSPLLASAKAPLRGRDRQSQGVSRRFQGPWKGYADARTLTRSHQVAMDRELPWAGLEGWINARRYS